MIAAGLPYHFGTPRSECAGDHGYGSEQVEGAALEVLAGDVFEGLPARPDVYPISYFGIAGYGADGLVCKMGDQAADRFAGDHGVGVDADVEVFGHVL